MTVQGSLTKILLPAFEERKGDKPQSNWLAFVGRGGGITNYINEVNSIEYEIKRGSRRMSKLVKRSSVYGVDVGGNQKELTGEDYTQVERTFPLSVEEYSIQASKLTEKIYNEPSINSGFTREMRMMYYAKRAQTDMIARQNKMMNYLCGQGILTGFQDAIIGTTDDDFKFDFLRNAAHQKTVATAWSTSATAVPLDDIDEGCSAVIAATGKVPEFGLIGNAAMSALLKTTQILGLADNRGLTGFVRIGEAGVACPSKFNFLTSNGWECRGLLTTWEGRQIWLFGSEELVNVTKGSPDERSMPSNKFVLGNTESRLDAQFGPPESFPETDSVLRMYQEWFGFRPGMTPSGEPSIMSSHVRPEMFHMDGFQNERRTVRTMRSQTAPLYIPVATDDWYVIENAHA